MYELLAGSCLYSLYDSVHFSQWACYIFSHRHNTSNKLLYLLIAYLIVGVFMHAITSFSFTITLVAALGVFIHDVLSPTTHIFTKPNRAAVACSDTKKH